MEKTLSLCKPNGFMAMINIPVWMFLSSYEKLRVKLIHGNTIISMVHPGRGIFGSDFGTTTFVIAKRHMSDYIAHYRRLFEKQGEVESIAEREQRFFEGRGCFFTKQSDLAIIPGCPVAYWVSRAMLNIFINSERMGEYAEGRKGLVTGNDEKYLKLWHEISIQQFSQFNDFETTKWKPCNKGGNYRKWYGNNEYVVNWGNDGSELANHRWPDGRQRSSLRNSSYFFREAITWTYITSGTKCFRYYPEGYAFAGVGPGLFPKKKDQLLYILAYTNSVVFDRILKMIGSSTISLESGEVERAPIVFPDSEKTQRIEKIVRECITDARTDWDSFETSWDFQIHPMVPVYADDPDYAYSVEAFYDGWKSRCQDRFDKLKANEEELNRIFIDIYGLRDELTPEVENEDVTVRLADLGRDVRSLISYAVGCMFGRHSANGPVGLIYAGGEWDPDRYGRFKPDADNIIPICDDEYFDDDIVGRFVQWLEIVYGKRSLEDNLKFIADALGGKGTPREVIRSYFLNDFYADHLKIYQKRPIYWLFDSGKKNGFKALVYMHRYQSDLLARMRTDYVHEQQERYRTQLRHIEDAMSDASTSERVKLSKQQAKLQEQALELQKYEEKIHHLADQNIQIDLDDGVKHNYALFADVLAKIK